MAQHSPTVEAEVREIADKHGWVQVKLPGRARVTCPCGLDTGMVPVSLAWGTATAHHVAAWP